MVNGYVRGTDNAFLARTRISNSTFIDHASKLNISDNVYIGHHNFIEASNGVTIGEGCQLTNFITITSHSSHDSIRLYGASKIEGEPIGYQKGPVEIGKFTYVGPYSTIMPNTKIGKGSIISAYSYVSGIFPDFAILQGNPAKIIGDTRERDAELLEKYAFLKDEYNKWTRNGA